MTRKCESVETEPEAVYRAIDETLQKYPETEAESSNTKKTREAIYHLEAALNELTLRREVIQWHARGISDRMITTFLALFPSTVAIIVSLHSIFKDDSEHVKILVIIYVAFIFVMGGVSAMNMKRDSTDNHLVGEKRRQVQQSLAAYQLRRDELQDQASTPAPGASRGFFHHR